MTKDPVFRRPESFMAVGFAVDYPAASIGPLYFERIERMWYYDAIEA